MYLTSTLKACRYCGSKLGSPGRISVGIQSNGFNMATRELWNFDFPVKKLQCDYKMQTEVRRFTCLELCVWPCVKHSSLHTLIEINSFDQLVTKTYPRLRRFNRWLLYFNEWSGRALNKERKTFEDSLIFQFLRYVKRGYLPISGAHMHVQVC